MKSTIDYYYNKYPELVDKFKSIFRQMEIECDDYCIDGHRILELGESNQEVSELYEEEYTCCESNEREVNFYGKKFFVGINYGH